VLPKVVSLFFPSNFYHLFISFLFKLFIVNYIKKLLSTNIYTNFLYCTEPDDDSNLEHKTPLSSIEITDLTEQAIIALATISERVEKTKKKTTTGPTSMRSGEGESGNDKENINMEDKEMETKDNNGENMYEEGSEMIEQISETTNDNQIGNRVRRRRKRPRLNW
jgi:hypothetical protein